MEFEPMLVAVELLERKPSHLYRMQLEGYFWMFWIGKNVRSEVQNFSLNGTIALVIGRSKVMSKQRILDTSGFQKKTSILEEKARLILTPSDEWFE